MNYLLTQEELDSLRGKSFEKELNEKLEAARNEFFERLSNALGRRHESAQGLYRNDWETPLIECIREAAQVFKKKEVAPSA